MKKILLLFTMLFSFTAHSYAASMTTHIVKSGESIWKIAVKYQVGVSEIIQANDQVKNPNLIYPNQKLNVPLKEAGEAYIEEQILKLVNIERSKIGATPLTLNWELSRVAKVKTDEMSNKRYFSHTSPEYGSPFDMMKKFGIQYRSAGENIAQGQKTPLEVMNSWMNSSGHKANILSNNFNQLGVGKSSDYWCQMFIKN
jgi:uncharacterized YkwD family protein/spore coat assembly protein SafA